MSNLKVTSIVLGALCALFVWDGAGYQSGIGLTLLSLGIIAQLSQLARARGLSQRRLQATVDSVSAVLLACVPAVSSNSIVVSISFSVLLLYLAQTILKISAGQKEVAIERLPLLAANFLGYFLGRFFEVILPALAKKKGDTSEGFATGTTSQKTWSAISYVIFSLPLLWLFHTLFAAVNADYTRVVQRVVTFILNIDAIYFLLRSAIHALLFYVLFTTQIPRHEFKTDELPENTRITGLSIPVVVLCLFFSLFQLSAVSTAASLTEFKQLSLYVQKGFWELLSVGLLGLSLWLGVHTLGKQRAGYILKKHILVAFSGVLLLITCFAGHKLALLQYYYGLKDQRIYASIAALLLAWAFSLSFFLRTKRIRSAQFLGLCLSGLLVTSGLASIVNIDALAARVHPIRFSPDPSSSLSSVDVSYLLGNSFDYIGNWEALMQNVIQNGVQIPEGYYWGAYRSICDHEGYYDETLHITKRYERLQAKYDSAFESAKSFGGLNFREYFAWRWLAEHQTLVESFNAALSERCNRPTTPLPSDGSTTPSLVEQGY